MKKEDIIICKRPIYIHKVGIAFGCSKCLACRIKQKRVWVARMLLEQEAYGENMLVATLTYDENNVPRTKNGYRTLSISDYQKFIKRLRKQTDKLGIKFKYFVAGEYGTKSTKRPHYHIIFFGLNPQHTRLVTNAWGLGKIDFDNSSDKAINYVAGYVTKKLTDVREHWEEQIPEFKRNSQGFGLTFLLQNINYYKQLQDYKKHNDAPLIITIREKNYPLGRYLRTKLRSAMNGIISSPDYIIENLKLKAQKLKEAWQKTKFNLSFRAFMGELASPYIQELEYKHAKLLLTSRSIT